MLRLTCNYEEEILRIPQFSIAALLLGVLLTTSGLYTQYEEEKAVNEVKSSEVEITDQTWGEFVDVLYRGHGKWQWHGHDQSLVTFTYSEGNEFVEYVFAVGDSESFLDHMVINGRVVVGNQLQITLDALSSEFEERVRVASQQG